MRFQRKFQFLKNAQRLSNDIYKILRNSYPSFMNNIFKVNHTIPYGLRKRNVLQGRNTNSVKYGSEAIPYLAPKIWSLVPETVKNCESLKSC